MGNKRMQIAEAKAECQRWLDYLDREKERSIAIQKIAAERRAGTMDAHTARGRLAMLDRGVTVYDGAKLAEAVAVLMKLADR